MRVLHVTNMYPTAARPAFGVFVRRQVEALARLGVSQSLYVIPSGSSTRYVDAARVVRARVRNDHCDLVHAHYGLSAWAAMWQPQPLVATFAGSDLYGHSDGRGGRTWRGRWEVMLGNWAARQADRVIVMTERMVHLIRSATARKRAVVLAYGIPVGAFRPGSREAARKRLGLPPYQFVVFWPHSASPTKRRDMAELAIQKLRAEIPHAVLWAPRVPPEQMGDCYRAADCLLVTSDTEGSPNVVREALCTALPVVSVDVGDVWQLIDPVDWCRRAEREPTDIAARLAEIARLPRPTEPPNFVREFDCERVASELIKIYESVLRNRLAS
jgi:teichuronic acid biosynthesis glycosyltransferase TuaC